MTENFEQRDLAERLNLIESMIVEGRRTTKNWGWTFVLWGVAYYVAIGWAASGHPALAWPVTMTVAGVITGLVASRRERNNPSTTLGRAMAGIWISLGVSISLLMMSLTWKQTHRFIRFRRDRLRHAGDGQRDLKHHSSLEGAIRMRSGLVDLGRSGVLRL